MRLSVPRVSQVADCPGNIQTLVDAGAAFPVVPKAIAAITHTFPGQSPASLLRLLEKSGSQPFHEQIQLRLQCGTFRLVCSRPAPVKYPFDIDWISGLKVWTLEL